METATQNPAIARPMVFPYPILRISGEPLSFIDITIFSETNVCCDAWMQARKELEAIGPVLCEALYTDIGMCTHASMQNALLNLKRAVFNLRPVSATQTLSLAPDSRKLLDQYQLLYNRTEELHRKGEEMFQWEIGVRRKELQKLADNDLLQKGLLLSSQSLLQNLRKYSDFSAPTKKNLQIENGLIKYLTRICTKTSPFSTFTSLSLARDDNRASAPDVLSGQISHVRINNLISRYLGNLLIHHPDLCLHFSIRVNPSLKQKETHYHFLINNNNVESFQRMEKIPVTDIILSLAASTTESLHGLITSILSEEVLDASYNDIRDYIFKLEECGLLEFDTGISGADPDWDIKLSSQLKKIDHRLAGLLVSTLGQLREWCKAYEGADMDKRVALLKDAFELLKASCYEIHIDAGLPTEHFLPSGAHAAEVSNKEEFVRTRRPVFWFRMESIFYEDTSREFVSLEYNNYEAVTTSIDRLFDSLSFFDFWKDEREKMYHFFDQHYLGKDRVGVLTFYEDYYKIFKKQEAEETKKSTGDNNNTVGIPSLEAYKQFRADWRTRVQKEKWEKTAEGSISIDPQRLESLKPKSAAPKSPVQSFACFFQPFVEREEDETIRMKGVLNNIPLPGFGKYYSRFLHIFPDYVTKAIVEENVPPADWLHIENCDASDYNGNIHPPLMAFEVWMPGSNNTMPAAQQIPVTDFAVIIDREQRLLKLVHEPTGKQAGIFDLGFQSFSRRSLLFQLLSMFSPVIYVQLTELCDALNPSVGENMQEVAQLPRIIYDNRVVIQRRSWLFPKEFLPKRKNDETDWEYFISVQQWKIFYNLPDEIFFRITLPKNNASRSSKASPDDYKPQYVHFQNPFLVHLFEKAITRVISVMKVEEMLPGRENMIKTNGQPYITEYLVQWYK